MKEKLKLYGVGLFTGIWLYHIFSDIVKQQGALLGVNYPALIMILGVIVVSVLSIIVLIKK